MRRTLFRSTLLLLAPALPLSAQVLFQEDFDGIPGPTAGGAGTYVFPAGWLLRNVDNRTPAGAVAYVNEAWERREDFSFNVTDSVAFSTSWYAPVGAADDWMWTPPITLTDNNVLRWKAVAYDIDFPDGYEVRLMAMPNVPTGGTGVLGNQVSASTQLFSTTAESSAWTDRSVSLAAYAGQTVRIAFRNTSNDKFVLLIDDIVVERQVSIDAEMLAADLPTRYTLTPVSQGAPLTLHGTIRNNGGQPLADVSGQVDVLRDGVPVFSQASTPQATLAPGASMDWTIPGYVPDAVGEHTVRYVARQTSGADQTTSNDTLLQSFVVTDSVYARDNGDVTGSLGIGAGDGGYLGQSFEVFNADTLTSIGVFFTRGYTGRRAGLVVWDMVGGVPNAIVAGTDTIIYPDDSARFYSIRIHGGMHVLDAGTYAVTAIEFDSTLAVGQTSGLFTNATTWVDWPSSPLPGWGHNEDFGGAFAKSYVIRPQFGHACAGFTLEVSTSPATCAACADGSAEASVTGGNGVVSYTWTPQGGNGLSITNVPHGVYTVTATDAVGCMASLQAVVAFDTCGAIAATVHTLDASCALCPDGSMWVDVTGDNGGLSYLWDTTDNTDSVPNATPGVHTVTVTDQYGCSVEASGTVDFSTGVQDAGADTPLSVFPNPNNGTFRLHIGDVEGPVDVLLVDASGATVRSVRWPTVTNGAVDMDSGLAAGVYTLHVRTGRGDRTLGVVIMGR